ncbi:GNAT family N-acetyltransferase [Micromonospora sp. RP3T]|uniref:GNAT family N-acetyltransferase n=1 Tax=Micromonospora sp. RP3T TaxID=2135446 RepID=UPI000D170AA0|nr:GNAT family N-acetyltransferase [Micromonospora sp. RP3T]PTA46529.1 hypothetical protein C8054_09060 [Micromonospora sp. RP3T]
MTLTLTPAPGTAACVTLVAELTRAAYTGSDPVDGLPVPDGARDTAASVAAQVDAGCRLWLARLDGRPVGALRSRPVPDAVSPTHRVERISVLPAWRGRAVAARALALLEDALAAEGIHRTEVHAVVERGLAPVYPPLGYLPVAHWPSPDKPLSEVTLRRELRQPRTPAVARPAREPAIGWPVSWFAGPAGFPTLAVCTGRGPVATRTAAHRRLARAVAGDAAWRGVDVWPVDPAPLLTAPVRAAAVALWPAAPATVRAHLMPRDLHPDALALWRRIRKETTG